MFNCGFCLPFSDNLNSLYVFQSFLFRCKNEGDRKVQAGHGRWIFVSKKHYVKLKNCKI